MRTGVVTNHRNEEEYALAKGARAILRGLRTPCLAALLAIWAAAAQAALMDFVTVGDPGNAPDPHQDFWGDITPLGEVDYTYRLGTYDVTFGQYTEFLNDVARTADPYGLYTPNASVSIWGAIGVISQNGSAGNYSYSIAGSNANLPVDFVSWGSAARYCNWLQNGRPTIGVENASTTETGAYALNGGTDATTLATVPRTAGATYWLPTLNEWYKAAYYKGGGVNAGYWLYPTQSNTPPSNTLPDNPTVILDVSPQVSALTLTNSNGASFTLAGTGTLHLSSTASGQATISIAGTHSISAALSLDSPTAMTTASRSDVLKISGPISGVGALSLDGPGELILSGTDTYSSGTNVKAGTLEVTNSNALPVGSSLTVGAGGVFIFDPTVSGASLDTASLHAASTTVRCRCRERWRCWRQAWR